MKRSVKATISVVILAIVSILPGTALRSVQAGKLQEARADPSITGQWSPVINLPAVPIHTHLLPNGSVLFWGRDDTTLTMKTWVLDVNSGTTTQVFNPYTNLFCSGHSFLPDGRLLVTGGHHFEDSHGEPHTNIFDYRNNTWTRAGDMNQGRWYPTNCTLANGDVLVVSGSYFNGTTIVNNTLPQVWSAAGGWRSLTRAQKSLHLYPFMLLAPNGSVFNSGPAQGTSFLNTSGTGAWSPGPASTGGLRDYGSSLMYDDGKVIIVGGGAPTNTAEAINLSRANPAWRRLPNMAFARRQMNATILADGKVLVTCGTRGAGFNDAVGSVFPAEMFDTRSETWSTLASMQVRRIYHSTALLLPDGRVLSAGGGGPPGTGLNPPDTDHPNMEIYSPPYLFKGPRPVISTSPTSISHGQTFFVRTPNSGDIADVIWVRLSSVTHAFNENQRINYLSFTPATQGIDAIGDEGESEPPPDDVAVGAAAAPLTGVNVTAPRSSNLCPPGHYMMFLVNRNGVPSIARIIRVTTTQPTNAIEDSRFFVMEQYYDMLNREPDLVGWQSHTRQITACINDEDCRQQRRLERARAFFDSQEFHQRFPSVVNPGGNPMYVNSEFVRVCYQVYLRRDPDPAGFNVWLNQLNQDNDYNRVIGGFTTSFEYRARFGQP